MKKFFLIPLLTLMCSVMAFANVARITFSDEREAVDCADLAALQTAIAALPTDGTVATIQLLDNINGGTLSGTNVMLAFLADQKVVLDLNGKTISANITSKTAYIINNDGAALTINDLSEGDAGVIENTNTATNHWSYPMINSVNTDASFHFVRAKIIARSGLVLYAEGNDVTIEEGTEMYAYMPYAVGSGKSNSPVIFGKGDTNITINGGYLESTGCYSIYLNSLSGRYPVVTIIGGTFKGCASTGVLEGDNTYTFDIQGGFFNLDPSAHVNQNAYSVLLNNGMYEVRAFEEVSNLTAMSFSELKWDLASATGSHAVNVTLGANIIVNEEVELKHGSQLIIPSGKTLSVVTGGLFINSGTTTNRGTIATEGAGFFSKPASVVLDGGNFTGYETAINEIGGGNKEYNVSTAMQLQFLSVVGFNDFVAVNILTDITCPDALFEPLADNENPNLVFNGNNHSINNFRLEKGSRSWLGLFGLFCGGTIKNLTINATINAKNAYCGVLGNLYPSEGRIIIENVTVNGTLTSSETSYGLGGLSGLAQAASGNDIWFVNCTNNVTISAPSAANVGGFAGTTTATTNLIGFYNCKNTDNISAKTNVGSYVGYGSASATYDFINCSNSGTISRQSGSAQVEGLFGANAPALSQINIAYIDPATYIAVYDADLDKYVKKEAGVLDNTGSTTTDWATNTTWTEDDNTTNAVPNASDDVTVSAPVVVNDGTEAEANKVSVAENQTLTIKDGASLTVGEDGLQIAAGATVTVEEGATLVVGANGITGDGELIVEATEDGGTGVVLVDPAAPAAKARPEASVELIPDAYKIAEDFYKHRYIGIPLYFEGAEEFTSANWEREAIQGGESVVSHAKIWNNGWQDVTSISEFVPFKGYALSNESTHGVKYTFKGKLVGNGNGTMNFTPGFNLFANSYTAPINIQTLLNGLTDDVKATIYMFDNDRLRSVSKADFAGFRTPKFTVIPSLQAFFVLMDDGTSASESINYAEAVFNNSLANGPLYAPKHQETPDFNRVRINIAAENGANDEVYLIEAADYTNDFENGYDEAKFMNNGLNIFATTAYGRQATQISNDLNGTFIGVQGNGTYTLSFDELVGEEYQIRDLQTNAVVTMSEANNYTFTVNGTNDARFVVETIAKMPTALDNVGAAKMFINNNTLYISENNSNANIMIYSANGQLVLDEVAQPTVSLNGLASGVYTVRVANQTLKFVK